VGGDGLPRDCGTARHLAASGQPEAAVRGDGEAVRNQAGMKKIVILGDGAWGTALALVLERGGHGVALWSKFPDYAAQMRGRRENVKFLPGVPLGPSVEVVSGAPPEGDVYIAAVPTQFIRPTF